MRKSYVMLFALIVLLSTAMSVQAMESKTIERQNGAHAFAAWSETNAGVDDIVTGLSVTETNDGTEIYFDMDIYDSGSMSHKAGYLFTKDNVFRVDPKLKSASLSEVQIDAYNPDTGEIETLTVQADWIGEGDASTGSYTSSSRNGDYVFKSSESSSYIEGPATGSANGLDFGTCDHAEISLFKSASITMEK